MACALSPTLCSPQGSRGALKKFPKDWSIACPWYARRRAMDAGREDIQWGIFVIPEVVVTKGHHVRVVRSDITRVTVSTHVCSLNLCDVNRRKIVHRWLASAHRVQVFK